MSEESPLGVAGNRLCDSPDGCLSLSLSHSTEKARNCSVGLCLCIPPLSEAERKPYLLRSETGWLLLKERAFRTFKKISPSMIKNCENALHLLTMVPNEKVILLLGIKL